MLDANMIDTPKQCSSDCISARDTLTELMRDPACESIVTLALDGCIEATDEPSFDFSAVSAVRHFLDCSNCQVWRATKLQPDLFARRHRIKQYCCGEMFLAIDGQLEGLSVALERLGPEHLLYWMMGEQRVCIRHCPWCGAALPENPFEPCRAES